VGVFAVVGEVGFLLIGLSMVSRGFFFFLIVYFFCFTVCFCDLCCFFCISYAVFLFNFYLDFCM